jgi:hypothetical protein
MADVSRRCAAAMVVVADVAGSAAALLMVADVNKLCVAEVLAVSDVAAAPVLP